MFDRYDWRRGRYITYDYQPKGDSFSRGLSDTPRVYTTVTHGETGRRFIRRTRTTDAQQLTVSTLLESLGPKAKEGLEGKCLYFSLENGVLKLQYQPPGTPLRFTSTAQRLGRRLWFMCPHCSRRVGKLFFVKLKFYEVVGCQKCLGLTYPSQAQHKCRGRDMAIIERKIEVGFNAWMAAHEREQHRLAKIYAQMEQHLNKLTRKRRRG